MNKKGTKKRNYARKAVAWCVLLTMLASLLQGFAVQPVRALDVYENLFSYDGRSYIYEGESLQFKAINKDVQWSCSDTDQEYCVWKTSGNNHTGTDFTITGKNGTEDGVEVTIRAEMSSYGYKEVTIRIVENDVIWFVKGGERVTEDSIDLTIDGKVAIKTNVGEKISFTNDSGYVTYEGNATEGYTISNDSKTQTTTNPASPVVMFSNYTIKDESDDNREHAIYIELKLHVIDALALERKEITMEKGTKNGPGTAVLQANPTNTSNTINWKVYKGKLTADEALASTDKEVTEYFTISAESSGNYGNYSQLNDRATLSITQDLVLSKEAKDRIYTVVATQSVYNERSMNAVCYVTVQQPATDLKLSMTEKTLYLVGEGEKGNNTANVTAELFGDSENGIDPDNKDVVWYCSNDNVATIKGNGTACLINAQKPGHCVVVASSKSNPNASDVLYIEVAPKVSTVEITNTDMTVNLAEQYLQLFANVQSNAVDEEAETEDYDLFLNALNTTVYWSSNRPEIAEVDMYTGKVKLKSAGKVTITCTSADDQLVSDSIVLTINVPVASIDLYYNQKKINVGESFNLDYTLRSAYKDFEPSNKEVTWETSDSKVATVDNDGKVTGVSGGTATILVRADDGQITATCTVEVYQAVSRIDISETTMDLNIGEEAVLEAMVFPSTASEQNVIWSSNKPDVVSVTQDGIVTANQVGDPAVITAYIVDKNATIKTTCIVNVVVPVTSLSLSPNSKTIAKGESFLLTKTITPADATNATVVYASTDTSVATVDENGNVCGITGGQCYITARTKNRDIMTSIFVTVKEDVKSITLNRTKKVMKKGSSMILKATVQNSTATNKGVVWSSSNKKVATVSSKGVVKAKGYGTATITSLAMDGSGKKATCKITVKRYVKKIALNQTSLTLQYKKSYQLKATVTPSNATNRKLTWSTSDSQVAKVDKGKVKATGIGSCYITCKATDGSGVKKRCKVVVKKKLSKDDITAIKY